MNRSTLLLSTAVGLTFAIAGPATAAVHHQLPSGVKSHAALDGKFKAPVKPSGSSAGKASKLSEVWATTTVFTTAGSFTPYDFVSGKCAGRTTCTVEIENLLQVYSDASFKEGVAIEPLVNGVYSNGAGYWQYQDSADVFVNQALRSNVTVNAGAWTATDYVYSSASLELGHSQSDYTSWKN